MQQQCICFDALADQFWSRLIVQVVRIAAGAELDPVGAFGRQHIYSGLDTQGMTAEAAEEAELVAHTCRSYLSPQDNGNDVYFSSTISESGPGKKPHGARDCSCHFCCFLQESLPLVGRLSNANFAQYERTRLPMLIMFLELPGERAPQFFNTGSVSLQPNRECRHPHPTRPLFEASPPPPLSIQPPGRMVLFKQGLSGLRGFCVSQ